MAASGRGVPSVNSRRVGFQSRTRRNARVLGMDADFVRRTARQRPSRRVSRIPPDRQHGPSSTVASGSPATPLPRVVPRHQRPSRRRFGVTDRPAVAVVVAVAAVSQCRSVKKVKVVPLGLTTHQSGVCRSVVAAGSRYLLQGRPGTRRAHSPGGQFETL